MAPSLAKESKSSGLKLHSPPSCPKARPAAPKSSAATDLGESSASPVWDPKVEVQRLPVQLGMQFVSDLFATPKQLKALVHWHSFDGAR